jgi:hypothetical protein
MTDEECQSLKDLAAYLYPNGAPERAAAIRSALAEIDRLRAELTVARRSIDQVYASEREQNQILRADLAVAKEQVDFYRTAAMAANREVADLDAQVQAEPPRPAAIVQVWTGKFEVFEDAADAHHWIAANAANLEPGYLQSMSVQEWHWHPARAAEGEAIS